MNNPVFPPGFGMPSDDMPDPDSTAGESPAVESKYQRKKKRQRSAPVVELLESVEIEPPRLLQVDAPDLVVAHDQPWDDRTAVPAQLDNGLPTDGGQPLSAQEAAPREAEVPYEWFRVTLHAVFGRRGVPEAGLTAGSVLPWADPLVSAGNDWRNCRMELGIWRMMRVVQPDGRVLAQTLPEESTVLSVSGAPFGFGGDRTMTVDCASAAVPPEWLDASKFPVNPDVLQLSGVEAQASVMAALRSIWPWFYLDADEVESPSQQVLKRVVGTGQERMLVPVLPVCVLPESASATMALRLRSRLMDRVGHVALFVGFGDRLSPVGSSSPLFADVPVDQMSVLDAWSQGVIDTSYSFDD